MRVVDASAVVEMVLAEELGGRVFDALGGDDLLAPDLLDVEVTSALARMERAGSRSGAEVDAAMEAFGELPVARVGSRALRHRAWQHRHRLRVADAFYVACAELVGAPLVTCDARLARSGVGGVVTLVR